MTTTKKCTAEPFLSAAAKFKSGKDNPRALLDRCLARIDAAETDVLAFVTWDRAKAIAAADASAKRWAEGKPLSAIDGMPIGVKDVIETIDMPTEMGSALYAGWRSQRDSASVRALREAGAVIIGKTVTTEFAATVPGPTRNPWDLSRTPGGSSSGSAAGTAAGFFSAALGTQVVGSILRPASYCGVYGFKPTFGAINRGGSHDHMSQSAQGVISATLADGWAVLRNIADRTGGDPGHPGLYGPADMPAARKPRALILLETPGWAEASDAAKAALEDAVKRFGDAGVEIRTRKTDATVEAVETAIGRAMLVTRKINAWESRWPLNTYRDRDAAKLSKLMVDRAAEAEAMTLEEFRGYLDERARMRKTFAPLAEVSEAAITLAAASEAPVGLKSTGSPTFVVPATALGVPAVTLPLLQANGLPLGLQVIGFEHKDADLMATAAGIEAILGNSGAVRA
jgi:Asp-tRNA(Asn)/Glu-tRNA(Gln) amidotransferase A subunit family amidase